MVKDVVVIGLGNPLMSDEGIGIRLIAELQTQPLPDTVELMDLGTSGMAVLHHLGGRSKVVFLDCACMGDPPGTLRRFTPDDVISKKIQTRPSPHSGDLLNTIGLARRLEMCPDEVVLFGVQPDRVEPGETLTPALEGRMDEYVKAVCAEVAPSTGSAHA